MGNYETHNNGYLYLLTAWAVVFKNKGVQNVTAAMKSVFNNSKRKPKNLQTDDGREFFNNQFQHLIQSHKIHHYSTYSSLMAPIVERFNTTLKGMMWKKFSFQGTYKWINIYQELIDKYNNTLHRTIKMTPNEVKFFNEITLLDTVYNNLKVFRRPKFKIGAHVRISKYKHIFEKYKVYKSQYLHFKRISW